MKQVKARLVLWKQALLALVTSLALLWPAVINGGPFWFPDTSTYIRAADAAFVFATGHKSDWSTKLMELDEAGASPVADAGDPNVTRESKGGRLVPTRPVLKGRSIYYGALLFFPILVAGPWAAIFAQALIASGFLLYCIAIVRRAVPSISDRRVGLVLAILVIATPLPFYASMLMPGVYMGVMILALSCLFVFWDHLSVHERLFLIVASGFMATFHTTMLLVAICMAIGGFLLLPKGRQRLRPVIAGSILVAITFAANAAFSISVEKATGIKPISPPFLTARLTAGEAGTAFTAEKCKDGSEPFAVCRYRDRFPLNSDLFLWDADPQTGIFEPAPAEEQALLAAQDKRFFFAVLAHDPVLLISSSLSDFAVQLVSFDLVNFNRQQDPADLDSKYPQDIAGNILESRAANEAMPVAMTVWLTIGSVVVSLAVLGWYAAATFRQKEASTRGMQNVVILAVLAILANAAICGAFSGPKARYQMRMIWILPAVAMLASASLLPGIQTQPAGRTKREEPSPAE